MSMTSSGQPDDNITLVGGQSGEWQVRYAGDNRRHSLCGWQSGGTGGHVFGWGQNLNFAVPAPPLLDLIKTSLAENP
jgi:hypothetical protein